MVDGRNGARDACIIPLVKRLGGTVEGRKKLIPLDTDIAISWRFKLLPNLQDALDKGVTCICLDLGYFDETKFEKFTISVNGVHGTSQKMPVETLPPRPKPELHPWRRDGRNIVILAPGATAEAQQANGSQYPVEWLDKTVEDAKKTGRPVIIRWHPRKLPYGVEPQGPIEDMYDDAYLAVTYQSTAAVQTIIAGVPTAIWNKRCAASPMCSYQSFDPIYPDRGEWLHDLSYREYDMRDEAELDRAAEYILMAHRAGT